MNFDFTSLILSRAIKFFRLPLRDSSFMRASRIMLKFSNPALETIQVYSDFDYHKVS